MKFNQTPQEKQLRAKFYYYHTEENKTKEYYQMWDEIFEYYQQELEVLTAYYTKIFDTEEEARSETYRILIEALVGEKHKNKQKWAETSIKQYLIGETLRSASTKKLVDALPPGISERSLYRYFRINKQWRKDKTQPLEYYCQQNNMTIKYYDQINNYITKHATTLLNLDEIDYKPHYTIYEDSDKDFNDIISHLPRQHQDALRWRHYHYMKPGELEPKQNKPRLYREIGECMGISPYEARKLVKEAEQMLRQTIDEHGNKK